MTPQELKDSIFYYAFRGKLVEQTKEDKPVKTSLFDFDTSTDDLNLDYIQQDTPFDIPNSWHWVKIGSLCNIINGFTPRRTNPEFWENGDIPWFTIEDVRSQGRFITQTAQHITSKALAKGSARIVPPSTVLLCCTASVGEYAFTKIELTTNQQFNALVIKEKHNTRLDPMYLYEYVQTLKKTLITNAGKTTINFLSVKKLSEIPIPLPPLSEQKRIVAKIEELLPYVERYEEAWNRLGELDKRFPGDLQKSVLQLAIQGKLVEQRPDEGTAEELYREIQREKQRLVKEGKIKKEKPLPEIKEDEIPFEIPDGWKWVRIGDLFQHNTGKALNSSDKLGKPYEYITTSNVFWNRFELDKLKTMLFTDTEIEKCSVQKGDLLVLEGGDVGRSAIWNFDYSMRIQNHIHRLRPFGSLIISFFYYIFFYYKNAGLITGKGISIQGLSSRVLHSLLVPLPPLSEQKRIVAKIEELLPLCERLAQINA